MKSYQEMINEAVEMFKKYQDSGRYRRPLNSVDSAEIRGFLWAIASMFGKTNMQVLEDFERTNASK